MAFYTAINYGTWSEDRMAEGDYLAETLCATDLIGPICGDFCSDVDYVDDLPAFSPERAEQFLALQRGNNGRYTKVLATASFNPGSASGISMAFDSLFKNRQFDAWLEEADAAGEIVALDVFNTTPEEIPTTALQKRQASPYNLFVAEFIKSHPEIPAKDRLTAAAAAWRNLSKDEKGCYTSPQSTSHTPLPIADRAIVIAKRRLTPSQDVEVIQEKYREFVANRSAKVKK